MKTWLERYFFHALIPLGFAGQLLFFCFLGAPVFWDADAAWHLAAGDLIRELGQLPEHDPWSFTAGEYHWYNIAWLFDVLISLLHELGGFSALYLFTLCSFALMGMLMLREAVRREAGFLPLLLVWIVCTCIIYPGVLLRPNLISMFFTVAFYLLLMRTRAQWNPLLYIFFPLMMLVWVNSHGGFAGGLVMIGLFFLEALYEQRLTHARQLFILGAVTALTIFINPYGYHLFEGMERTLGSALRTEINEWKPAALNKNYFYALFLLLAFPTLAAPNRVVPLAEKLLVLLWLFMGLNSVRHTIIMAMISLPALATGLTYMLNESRYGKWWKATDARYQDDMRSDGARQFALWMALFILMGAASPWPRDMLLKKPQAALPEQRAPMEEIAYIREHYPRLRLINHYDLGGFMVLLGRGNPPIFIDGRADTAYPKEVLQDYVDFFKYGIESEKATAILEKYRIDGLILPNSFADMEYWKKSPPWKEAFKGKAATVLVRKGL